MFSPILTLEGARGVSPCGARDGTGTDLVNSCTVRSFPTLPITSTYASEKLASCARIGNSQPWSLPHTAPPGPGTDLGEFDSNLALIARLDRRTVAVELCTRPSVSVGGEEVWSAQLKRTHADHLARDAHGATDWQRNDTIASVIAGHRATTATPPGRATN